MGITSFLVFIDWSVRVCLYAGGLRNAIAQVWDMANLYPYTIFRAQELTRRLKLISPAIDLRRFKRHFVTYPTNFLFLI